MKYTIRGKKSISLTQNDFIAKGGEGQIFGRGKTIYKIYHDPSRMIPDAKIAELQVLNHPNILTPDDVILNKKKTPVGFTMQWVKNTIPLCKLFTNDFRNRNGITHNATLELVENIKETLSAVHQNHCLVVDGNEFNYLVDQKKMVRPYFIDVDSYQTPGYPATAIMPSVRDHHTQGFNELSDFFSFAVVACQLFVGIHPFKGRHPDFKKNDIESRMKANVSIFNSRVKVPPAARDLNLIPSAYYDWFLALFEEGRRLMPPALPGQVQLVTAAPAAAQGTDRVDIRKLRNLDGAILWHRVTAGMQIIRTADKIFIDQNEFDAAPGTDVVLTARRMLPVFCNMEKGRLKLVRDNGYPLSLGNIQADEMMVINNTLFTRFEENLTEIEFEEVGNKILPTIKHVWPIMPHSSDLFDSVIFQSVLGKPFLVIPLPKKDGASACMVKQIPELEPYRIVDARHDQGVCMLTGFKGGRYDRILLRFDKTYGSYDCRITKDVDLLTVNFTVLDNGIAVAMVDYNELEIFSKQPGKAGTRNVEDKAVDASMTLSREGNTVLFFKDAALYRMTLSAK